MADFKGFTCDQCKQGPFPDEERTQTSITFKGKIEGSTKPDDLCVDCAKKSVEGIELVQPKPKKKSAKKSTKVSMGAPKPAAMTTGETPARL